MNLELTEQAAEELRETLKSVVSDMSSEIADTDNASYRADLSAKRDRLQAIAAQIEGAS
jgi:acetolactate synthase small subunit